MSRIEFKTGQQVLVRVSECAEWSFDLFSHYEVGADAPYVCTGNCNYEFCLPFNAKTEHLVGTHADPQVAESTRFKCGQWVDVEMERGIRVRRLYLMYKCDGIMGACHLVFSPEDPKFLKEVSPSRIYAISE